MKLNEIKYDIAAQLDSNGKEVKLPKISTPTRIGTVEVGEKYKNGIGMYFIVTKVTDSKIYLDRIEKDGTKVQDASKNEYSHSAFKKYFRKF